MRSAEQISRTPYEYAQYRKAEQERNLREALRDLHHARDTKAEWYMWVLNGRPVLTDEEYAKVGKFGKGKAVVSPRNRGKESPSMGDRATQPEAGDA